MAVPAPKRNEGSDPEPTLDQLMQESLRILSDPDQSRKSGKWSEVEAIIKRTDLHNIPRRTPDEILRDLRSFRGTE